ncbi:SDR family oxidoreductase [Salinibaculum salinum]|uniref:SDR family NAD(P)-dependent oxidoreductase n=1 Tax=Salinibaculum salinum TaxID=3131996 RepID=UPI0030ED1687
MDGQTAVVTGASRGIGEAVAHAFSDAGAHVVVCARDGDAVSAVADAIRADGGSATAQRADVRDEFDVERLMEQAAREGGEIDIVVANAGVYHGTPGQTPLSGESYSAFDDHLRTNARGVFATIREALPHLAPDGRVLVTSGAVARDTRAGFGSYAVSKAAAESVAMHFADDIDQAVAVVDPGQVATDLTGGQGRDTADVALQFRWAARDAEPTAIDGTVVDRRTYRRETE